VRTHHEQAAGCRLIINADDFGWSEGANEAILALWDEGAITSCSWMPAGPAAAAAIDEARKRPDLPVGLHLTLVHGYPVLPREQIPLLVDREGRLSRAYARAGALYSFSPPHRGQWLREMEAQFIAFAATGLSRSHVDTHVHFGLTPAVFRDLLRLAERYGVRAVRTPEDDFAAYQKLDPADGKRQRGAARWFSACCAAQRTELRRRGFVTTDRCFGFFRSERLDERYLTHLAESLPDGDFELHCHPRMDTEAGRIEADALRSPGFRQALAARGVQLVSWAGLGRKTQMQGPVCRSGTPLR
jgi:hopanoid biosynthesis associated protein HpnK